MIVAFKQIPSSIIDASRLLGAKAIDRFFTIALPLGRHGFLVACVMTFAHTIGEFGIVLMIGGNIPEETRVVSIALFDYVEAMDYQEPHSRWWTRCLCFHFPRDCGVAESKPLARFS